MADELRELISRSLAGDQQAMLELVERFKGRVFGLCYLMLGHRHDAEDVAQETFVRALRSLGGWDSSREFEPWLLAIAGNRCRTLLASRRRRPASIAELDRLPDDAPDGEAASNLLEEVKLALCHVREDYRRAFLLFHEQSLSYDEIGGALGCPVGTAKTWVHRARKELVERLRRRGVLHEVRHAMRRI